MIKRRINAFSIVELLLAIGIFGMVVMSIVYIISDSLRASQNSRLRSESTYYIQEMINGIIANKNSSWSTILALTDAGPKHFEFSNNKYVIVDGSDSINGISLNFQVTAVFRDSSGAIVSSGGTPDIQTRLISFNANWTDIYGEVNNFATQIYVNNWGTPRISQNTYAKFNNGTVNNTVVNPDNDGNVTLAIDPTVFPDWCNPQLTLTEYDMPGQSVAQAIHAIPGNAFLGAGQNASGYSFINTLVDAADPPNVTVPGTYNGAKVNDIFGDGQYIYIATDTNSKEIQIINVQSTPYTEVGYFNTPSDPSNAIALFVSGTRGYMTDGSRFRIFDLTGKTGSRAQLGTITLPGSGSDIVVSGNYAYVSISGASQELVILNITDPAAITQVGYTDVNGQAANSIYLTEDTNRVYLATNADSSRREVFIIDTSVKTGNRPLIGSYESNGMDVEAISVIPNDNRAIAVGRNGEEYQVINISNEASPTRCGGIQINSGVNGIASVILNENAYSYILTNDSSKEFKVIIGGPGVEGQYFENGEFSSGYLDTGVNNPDYQYVAWTQDLPENTNIKIQMRAATSTTALASATWVGPDGTASTYFLNPLGEYIPASFDGKRYVQYKVIFESDRIYTPVLEEIFIYYEG